MLLLRSGTGTCWRVTAEVRLCLQRPFFRGELKHLLGVVLSRLALVRSKPRAPGATQKRTFARSKLFLLARIGAFVQVGLPKRALLR